MSNRLHYQKKHVVEYGPEEDFSHMEDKIYKVLVMHGCSVYADNCEDASHAESFYVSREDIKHMLDIMNSHSDWTLELKSNDGSLSWDVKDLSTFFQAAYDNSEGDYIYFEWF